MLSTTAADDRYVIEEQIVNFGTRINFCTANAAAAESSRTLCATKTVPFMSETTAYLVPIKHFDTGEFEAKIKTVFENLKLIDGYYDKDHNWFAAGENALSLFADSAVNENPPFEYVEIHDTKNKRLLPEGFQGPVQCQSCQTDISEDVNDLLYAITEKEHEEKNETDLAAAELLCPNCGKKSKLSELGYHEKVAFSNQYVCFVAIEDDLNKDKLVEIGNQIGGPFDVIYSSI